MVGKSMCLLVLSAAIVALGSSPPAALSADVSSKTGTGSPDDAQFLQMAAAAGVAEVELGELALGKSSNKQVKRLAKQIVDDYRKDDSQLATLAKQKQMALPSQPDAEAAKSYATLGKTSGPAFDQAWAKLLINNHQQALKLFTAENKDGKDPDLRKFAGAALPRLQEHLKSAQQITAAPRARDKAMDTTMKAMSSGTLGPPASATTAAAVPADTAVATPMPAAKSVQATNPPIAPSPSPAKKH